MPMPDPIILTVRENPRRPGRWYGALHGCDIVLSRTPLLSAARVLLAGGTEPDTPLLMQHEGDNIISMRTTVGEAAKLGG
jgi:hypothetical protein